MRPVSTPTPRENQVIKPSRTSALKSAEPGLKRRPTINDIARLANVSKKTVSRVLNNSPFVREETRRHISAIMNEMGYVPDPQARGLAFRRSFLIGMIYDNPNAQFVVGMQQGVLDGLRGAGYELVLHPCNRLSKTLIEEVMGFVERQKLYGVVLLPPVCENDRLTQMLEERGCHYVRVASALLDAPSRLVLSTDRAVAADAARHLADLGHTRIAMIAGPPGYRSRKERRDGFVDGLRSRGLDLAPDYVVDGAYTYESGVEGARALLSRKPRPTAIFASNDEMAAGVYQVAREMQLAIPRDLSIVGFDDTPMSARLAPPLTTVRWPIAEMGRAAAEKLLAAEAGGDEPSSARPFPAHLVERESTAPPPRA
ncbi:MAG: LacI family DNA-binding transcriptional regulator [Hyphomonadaceae bacterium]|nr:LacI family DNA-binding transcriptional regulator [Hyphomonadaceae bacterium]